MPGNPQQHHNPPLLLDPTPTTSPSPYIYSGELGPLTAAPPGRRLLLHQPATRRRHALPLLPQLPPRHLLPLSSSMPHHPRLCISSGEPPWPASTIHHHTPFSLARPPPAASHFNGHSTPPPSSRNLLSLPYRTPSPSTALLLFPYASHFLSSSHPHSLSLIPSSFSSSTTHLLHLHPSSLSPQLRFHPISLIADRFTCRAVSSQQLRPSSFISGEILQPELPSLNPLSTTIGSPP